MEILLEDFLKRLFRLLFCIKLNDPLFYSLDLLRCGMFFLYFATSIFPGENVLELLLIKFEDVLRDLMSVLATF